MSALRHHPPGQPWPQPPEPALLDDALNLIAALARQDQPLTTIATSDLRKLTDEIERLKTELRNLRGRRSACPRDWRNTPPEFMTVGQIWQMRRDLEEHISRLLQRPRQKRQKP